MPNYPGAMPMSRSARDPIDGRKGKAGTQPGRSMRKRRKLRRGYRR